MTIDEMKVILSQISSTPGRIIGSTEYRASSVVIPLIPGKRLEDWQILYEKRAAHIPQGGESCFPGGKLDQGESPFEAAFRELDEETGITETHILFSGFYGTLVNPGGRLLYIYYAGIHPDVQTRPNEEVEKLFTLSLGQLLEAEISEYHIATSFTSDPDDRGIPYSRYNLGSPYQSSWRGADLPVYFYEGMENLVWGMTAKITRDFVQDVFGAARSQSAGKATRNLL